MRIIDETGKEMGMKPRWTWEWKWEWLEWTVGNEREYDWKRHSRSSLL